MTSGKPRRWRLPRLGRPVGILAYGSLRDDPGDELAPCVARSIPAETPFPVEFARRSTTRGGAPTLTRVEQGRRVEAEILVLDRRVTVYQAEQMLYRRETDSEGTYRRGRGGVGIERCRVDGVRRVHPVLYAQTRADLSDEPADGLARLAVESVAQLPAGRDGVSYLMAVTKHGVVTEKSDDYRAAILRRSGAESLDEALALHRSRAGLDAPPPQPACGDFDKAYDSSVYDLLKGSVDRSRAAAELVQKAAASVGTLYAAVLGVAFSVSTRPLPARGVIPAFYLGLAIALSTFYVAYFTSGRETPDPDAKAAPHEQMVENENRFADTVDAFVRRRRWSLRMAVLCLGAGVVALPVPFVKLASVSAPSLGSKYDWPDATTLPGRDPAEGAIVFKAQVDEVAAARARAQQNPTEHDGWVFRDAALLLAAMALLVLVVQPLWESLLDRGLRPGRGPTLPTARLRDEPVGASDHAPAGESHPPGDSGGGSGGGPFAEAGPVAQPVVAPPRAVDGRPPGKELPDER